LKDKLAIADKALGKKIREKLGIRCVHHDGVNELMRGIRLQLEGLLEGVDQADLSAMSLGLSHSLSRYQLKFSPDKVDTMIVQAIGFLDDLDKELNNYAMRLREWYGWHFPELPKIVTENKMFARTVLQLGSRSLVETADLDSVLPEDLVEEVKAAARVSMGTEISEEDTLNIHVRELCLFAVVAVLFFVYFLSPWMGLLASCGFQSS
jgi:nucleolar protein 58